MTVPAVISLAALLASVPRAGSAVATSGQAYVKAVNFLRAQGATGWEGLESQPVLLGEAIAGDPLAAGPRSTTLLASLELSSVDARGRRMSALASHKLSVVAAVNPLLAGRTPALGFGANRDYLPTPLDTALAVQALDAAGWGISPPVTESVADLVARQLPSGMWPLVRGGTTGDFATSAQALLALAPRQSTHPGEVGAAVLAIGFADPARASERALQVLALLAVNSGLAEDALDDLVAQQNANGSFGSESDQADRVYATALAARALLLSSEHFPFDSDGDGVADGPDPDSDQDPDHLCDPGESDPSCTGSDAFPTDPGKQYDTDGDGIPDGTDLDDDGDGVPDTQEPSYKNDAQERVNTDGDSQADTLDPDDDNDTAPDVEELLAGLDPRLVDTDGDSFRDNLELLAGTDGRNATQYPLPDGDVFPIGAPDGVVDDRDALAALRILRGLLTVPGSAQTVFLRHADVAPLSSGGSPSPSGAFDDADALVIVRRVRGLVAIW